MATQQEIIQLLFEVGGQDLVDRFSASLNQAKSSAEGLSPELQAAANEIDALTTKASRIEAFAALKAQASETALKLQDAKAGLAGLNAEFDRTDTSNPRIVKAFTAAEQAVANLTTQHNALSAQLQRSGADLERSGVSTSNLAGAHAALASEVAAASEKFVQLSRTGASTTNFLQSIKTFAGEVGEKLKGAGERALEFGKHLAELTGIAGVVAAALGALTGEKIFGEGIKEADEFEHSITKSGIAVNATAEELEALAKAAEDAAEKTGTSGSGAAAALAILAKGAGDANSAIAELQPTLLLAKAAQIDTATAADILGTAIAEFGLQASDSTRVVDLLAKTAATTKSDLAELSAGFGKVAPDAKAAGVSIEQVATLFGALSDQGIRGKKATQDLQLIFGELANKASPLSAKLRELGLSGDDLTTILKKLSGNSFETARVIELLGSKGGSAFRALIAAVPDIDRVNAALGRSGGAAQSAADKFDKELGGAFTNFKNAFVDATVALAKPLLEPLARQFTLATTTVREFTKTADFAKIRDAILDFVTKAVASFNEFVRSVNFSKVSDSISSFVTTASGSFDAFKGAIAGTGRVVEGIAGAISTVFNAIKLVIVDVVAVVDNSIGDVYDTFAKLARITGKSQEVIDAAKKQADDFHKTSREAYEKSGEAVAGLAEGLGKLDDAITSSGEASAAAAPKHAAHSAALKESANSSNEAAEKTSEVGAAADIAVPKIVALTQKQSELARISGDAADAVGKLKIPLQSELVSAAKDSEDALNKVVAAQRAGILTIEDSRRAFAAYAAAQRAAVADSDQYTKDAVEAQLKEKEAALGLVDALGKVHDAGAHASDGIQQGAQEGAEKLKEQAKAAEEAKHSLEDYAGQGGSSLAQLDDALANTRGAFLGISEAAAKAFDAHLVSDFNLQFDSTGIGIGRMIAAMNEAALETQKDVNNQRKALNDLIGDLNSAGEAGRNSFGDIGKYAGRSVEEIQAMIDEVKNGTSQFNLLGQQDLAPLLQALDAAKQKAQAAADAAKQAADEFDNLAKSIHDQLLQEQGDQLALENERHQEQLDKLKELADSGQIDSAKYAQAVSDENALHELKMKHIEEQQQKQDQANQKQQQQQSSGGSGSGGGSNSAGSGSGSNGGGGSGQSSSPGGLSGSLNVSVSHGDVHVTLPPGGMVANMTAQDWDHLKERLVQEMGEAMAQKVIDALRWSKGMS